MESKYQIFDDNLKLFDSMMEDMKRAKRNIFLETFRFGKDAIGEKFRLILYQKLKEGVEVRLLLDAWGTGSDTSFFQGLVDQGLNLRLYRKVRIARGILAKNHQRNHRKFLIIDSEIAYMGSANITAYSLSWRELNLRTTDKTLIKVFRRSFRDSYRTYNKYDIPFVSAYKTYTFDSWVFIQDFPDPYRQRIKSTYEQMVRSAKEEIIIETPYFLPGYNLRKELVEACNRGVKVRVLVPYNSDVRVVDIIRRHYLGKLYEAGVEFHFYVPANLHAKSLMIDRKKFSISSANFDYRSFRYQYEVALIGSNNEILSQLVDHYKASDEYCKGFDYENWKNRPQIDKFLEYILLPFRYLM